MNHEPLYHTLVGQNTQVDVTFLLFVRLFYWRNIYKSFVRDFYTFHTVTVAQLCITYCFRTFYPDSTFLINIMVLLPAVEESDIIDLEKRYWLLKAQSRTGRFDLETFVPLVSPPIHASLSEGKTLCI